MYQATINGDYKANNKEGKRLLKYYKYFERDREFACDCINDMLKSKNIIVRTDAAAYCLALNIYIDVAQKVLAEISSKKENGIFGFNAEMILGVWKKQGFLEIYQKDKQ